MGVLCYVGREWKFCVMFDKAKCIGYNIAVNLSKSLIKKVLD